MLKTIHARFALALFSGVLFAADGGKEAHADDKSFFGWSGHDDPSISEKWKRTVRKNAENLTRKYGRVIRESARENGMTDMVAYIAAMVMVESGRDECLTSHKEAKGLLQLTRPALADIGMEDADMCDPTENIRAGIAYLGKLRRDYRLKPPRETIVGYFEGPKKALAIPAHKEENHPYWIRVKYALPHVIPHLLR